MIKFNLSWLVNKIKQHGFKLFTGMQAVQSQCVSYYDLICFSQDTANVFTTSIEGQFEAQATRLPPDFQELKSGGFDGSAT
jgi:hypothetical protein